LNSANTNVDKVAKTVTVNVIRQIVFISRTTLCSESDKPEVPFSKRLLKSFFKGSK
jgi:hypothetical protein